MDAIATQERARVLSWRMTIGDIGIGAEPREDRSAIDDQIPRPNQPRTDSGEDAEDKERLWEWGCGPLPTFADARDGLGMRGQPSLPKGKPHARAKAGQARNQSRMS